MIFVLKGILRVVGLAAAGAVLGTMILSKPVSSFELDYFLLNMEMLSMVHINV